jgi:HD-GYP domain-containing protein (c-di-GMP phosphodiesterase class II)
MICYSLKDVSEGMILGRSIFSPNGTLLVAAGFRITEQIIARLKHLQYNSVYINDKGTEGIIPEDIVNEQVRCEAEIDIANLQNKASSIIEIREESADKISRILEDKSGLFKEIQFGPVFKRHVGNIVESLLSSNVSILNLSAIKTMSGYAYQHALNTAVISLYLGMQFNYTRYELEELGIGALLMDTGMIAIPKKILEKEGKLSQEEFLIMREHPNYGFVILQNAPNQIIVPRSMALQHHERQDGTGYPRAIRGTNEEPLKRDVTKMQQGLMHRYAEIMAAADAYDAMTTTRPYAAAKSPAEAIKELIKVSGTQLNRRVIEKLVRSIPVFPKGCRIEVISSINPELIGCQGVVAEVRSANLYKPVVLLMKNKRGVLISPPQVFDLAKLKGFEIKLVL